MKNPFKRGANHNAFNRGRRAAIDGKPRDRNPYERANPSTLAYHKLWIQGFDSVKPKQVCGIEVTEDPAIAPGHAVVRFGDRRQFAQDCDCGNPSVRLYGPHDPDCSSLSKRSA